MTWTGEARVCMAVVLRFLLASGLAMLLFVPPQARADDSQPRPIRIVAFGDSTTAPRDRIVVYADRLREEATRQGRAMEVINAGVPGNSTEDARERFARDVLDAEPDLVILQFGINDSAIDVWRDPPETAPRVSRTRFKENLAFFLWALKQRGVAAVLMTPNPMRWAEKTRALYNRPPYDINDPDGFNLLLNDYAEAVREVAAVSRVSLVDVYAAFQEHGSRAGQSMDELLLDGMHPNNAGHALVTERLCVTIDRLALPATPYGALAISP